MTGIDIVTRDLADMPNGAAFVTHSYARWGADYPISGDEIARTRADLREIGGADCD